MWTRSNDNEADFDASRDAVERCSLMRTTHRCVKNLAKRVRALTNIIDSLYILTVSIGSEWMVGGGLGMVVGSRLILSVNLNHRTRGPETCTCQRVKCVRAQGFGDLAA